MAGQPQQTLDERYDHLKGNIDNATTILRRVSQAINESLSKGSLSSGDVDIFADAINGLIERRNNLYRFFRELSDLEVDPKKQESWTSGYPTPQMLCESIKRNQLPSIDRIITDAETLQKKARDFSLQEDLINKLSLSPRGCR